MTIGTSLNWLKTQLETPVDRPVCEICNEVIEVVEPVMFWVEYETPIRTIAKPHPVHPRQCQKTAIQSFEELNMIKDDGKIIWTTKQKRN